MKGSKQHRNKHHEDNKSETNASWSQGEGGEVKDASESRQNAKKVINIFDTEVNNDSVTQVTEKEETG